MFGNSLPDRVYKIIEESGPISVRGIMEFLSMNYRNPQEREQINSLLYGVMRSQVIRDKNEDGLHTWRIKGAHFEAAKGLEVMFYTELIKQHIISEETAQLDMQVEHRRARKVYHLDISVEKENQKFDIEIDGFEHLRADAMNSIQRQIEENGEDQMIEIDWMDHERSFVRYDQIDKQVVYKWCNGHPNWCIRFHEELLWPHDISRNIWLIDNGWRIIRFWNFEIKNEMERCVDDVKSFIKG